MNVKSSAKRNSMNKVNKQNMTKHLEPEKLKNDKINLNITESSKENNLTASNQESRSFNLYVLKMCLLYNK